MWTPKTKWQTCWPKVVSRVMNGTIFCIYSTSWISRHFLAAISFVQTESRVLWYRKGLKKAFHTIRQRWRQSQGQERWILCRIETCLLWDSILKKRMILNSRWVTEQIWCSPALGNRGKRAQIVCLCTLKRGHKESIVKLVPNILTRM